MRSRTAHCRQRTAVHETRSGTNKESESFTTTVTDRRSDAWTATQVKTTRVHSEFPALSIEPANTVAQGSIRARSGPVWVSDQINPRCHNTATRPKVKNKNWIPHPYCYWYLLNQVRIPAAGAQGGGGTICHAPVLAQPRQFLLRGTPLLQDDQWLRTVYYTIVPMNANRCSCVGTTVVRASFATRVLVTLSLQFPAQFHRPTITLQELEQYSPCLKKKRKKIVFEESNNLKFYLNYI